MSPRFRIGFGLALLAALCWSATGPGIKFLLDTYHMPNLAVAFWRDAIIAVFLGVLALFHPNKLRVSIGELRSLALVGALSIGLYHALWILSIALNGAAVAVVLVYTFPSFVTLGSWLLFGQKPRAIQLGALLVSLLGCALLAQAYDPAILRLNWLGLLVGFSTGLAHAGYVLFSQRSVQTHSPWTSLTYTMAFGALALLGLSLLNNPADLAAAGTNPAPWLLLAVLAIGPTLGGYGLFTLSLRYLPAPTASLVAVSEAPAGALLAFVILGEQLDVPQLVGIMLIIGSIIAPQFLARQKPAEIAVTASAEVQLS